MRFTSQPLHGGFIGSPLNRDRSFGQRANSQPKRSFEHRLTLNLKRTFTPVSEAPPWRLSLGPADGPRND